MTAYPRDAITCLTLLLLLAACATAVPVAPATLSPATTATAEATLAPTRAILPTLPLPPTETPAPPAIATSEPTAAPTAEPTPAVAPTETPAPTATEEPTAEPTAEKVVAPYAYKEVVDKDGVKYASELDFSAQDTDGNMKVNYRVSVAAVGRINEAIQGGSVVGIDLAPGALDKYAKNILKDQDRLPFVRDFLGPDKPPISLRVVTGDEFRQISGSPIQTSQGDTMAVAVNVGQSLVIYTDFDMALAGNMTLVLGATEAEKFKNANEILKKQGFNVDKFWAAFLFISPGMHLEQYLRRSGDGRLYDNSYARFICGETPQQCENLSLEVFGR